MIVKLGSNKWYWVKDGVSQLLLFRMRYAFYLNGMAI